MELSKFKHPTLPSVLFVINNAQRLCKYFEFMNYIFHHHVFVIFNVSKYDPRPNLPAQKITESLPCQNHWKQAKKLDCPCCWWNMFRHKHYKKMKDDVFFITKSRDKRSQDMTRTFWMNKLRLRLWDLFLRKKYD